MTSNRKILQSKIRDFVKKYYLNRLLKGVLLSFLIALLTFVVFSLSEYFSYFNTTVRTILFYLYVALCGVLLAVYIVVPLLKLAGLGKQLSKREIAAIIGKHFSQIDDKLLNLFELERQMELGDYRSFDLLSAAIDNKIASFKAYSFVQAVPMRKTRRFARWIILPVAIFALLMSVKGELFTEPAKRIVHYSEVYEKPAPYRFEITNKKMRAFQHDDFTVCVKAIGEELPAEVYIRYDRRSFKCHKQSNSEFDYTFSNLQKNTDFQFVTDEVQSKPYRLTVLPKPITVGFSMELDYPAYLHKPDEILADNGNATVPEGTRIKWDFYTKNTDTLKFIVGGKTETLSSDNGNYLISKVIRDNFKYSILNENAYYTSSDTLTSEILVIKDAYPEIFVQCRQDSVFNDRFYFKGNIRDDYGFSALQFVYTRYDENEKPVGEAKTIDIPFKDNVTLQDFYYYFDAVTFGLNPGDRIEYYFQVSDNDGVNGRKTSKSSPAVYRMRTREEIERELENADRKTKTDYEDILDESAKLLKDIDRLQTEMMQEKDLSWQDKKKLEKLMQQYQELKSQMEAMKRQQENRQSAESRFKDIDPEIIEKQLELQKRMDQVLTDEMKEMVQKLQNMMQQIDKNQIQNQMKKMKNSTEDIKETLDQQLQLYKQLEVEKKLKEAVQQLRDLAGEQRKNAKKTDNRNYRKEDLQYNQRRIQEKFDRLKNDIREMNSLNRQLEDPNKLRSTDEMQQKVDELLRESMQNIEKGNRAKSSKSQNDASDNMDMMANQLEQDFNESELENVSEDIETLRQILDNLVKISFDQEEALALSEKLNARSPSVTGLMRSQHRVADNMQLIEDSLNALARRQTSVRPFIQTEVSKIKNYLDASQQTLHDRKLKNAARSQQFALTSMNNLALMLNESLNEMKEKKSQCNSKCNKSGNGSCSKPGGKGKRKKTSARELQQQLNRQMEALKRTLQQQQGQGQAQPKGAQQQQYSEQFAKMAAQQEAIRKMLEDCQDNVKSQQGVGDKDLQKLIDDMKKTESELVHRQLNQNTLNRQKQITTRLLESERADMEREKEEQRKSEEAIQTPRLNPPQDWDFDKRKSRQNEMLRTVPATLNYYYKEKADLYFYNIE